MSRIGIVEDTEVVRDLLEDVLTLRGHEVDTCTDLASARARFLATPPKLMIIDIGLPDGCGLELVEELRRLHTKDEVAILILSGQGSETDLLRGFGAGASDYLTKPISPDELGAKSSVLLARLGASLSAPHSVTGKLPGGEEKAFGRYRITGVLGKGGSGVVYEAVDLQEDRPVALKVLGALECVRESARRRFVREIYTLSTVTHANLVNVYDFGTAEGRLYYAMERVVGPTLQQYVKSMGPLNEVQGVQMLTVLANALEALGRAELVHRDIKPANIVLRDGCVQNPVLVDFGLAKASHDRSLTKTNEVVGTPAFMTPECVMGHTQDARSDLFSLGLVVRYALTGRDVFDTENYLGLLQAIASRPIPIPRTISTPLREVLKKLTKTRRELRHASPAALLADLADLSSAPKPASA